VRMSTTEHTLEYDILLCDKVIAHIQQGVHWVLAAINLRDYTLRYFFFRVSPVSQFRPNFRKLITVLKQYSYNYSHYGLGPFF